LTEGRSFTEEIKVTGDALLTTVRKLLHQGNVRHIRIRNEDGRTLLEFPLTFGVVGTMLAPTAAAIGALAALVTSCTIEIEKTDAE
jgi:hypothetical protein